MDVGIKIIYLRSFGNDISIYNIYHELTKSSPVFYYFERNGISPEYIESKLEIIRKKYGTSTKVI